MEIPGVLMLDLEGPLLSPEESELLLRPEVGGVILFGRNYASPRQLADLVASIREVAPGVLLGVDQEGGPVQRFRDGFLALPPLRRIGECYEADQTQGLALARECGWAMAAEILQYGLDFSFAPVLDLYTDSSRVIGSRAFAADPGEVIALARAYIDGMHDAGMAATGKHFPGHGTVHADSHVELPVDERCWEQLRDNDLRCFAGCLDKLDAIMPAHVVYPAVDKLAAGFSQTWIGDKLRGELGFNGVVFSDDLGMEAARSAGGIGDRLRQALTAGCDMVLLCNDRQGALTAADWLRDHKIAGNERLAVMRGRPGGSAVPLYETSRWRQAKAAVAALGG